MSQKQRFVFEVDRGQLFDAIAATGDGGQAVGTRLAGVLLAGAPDFFEAVGLAAYGIEVVPGPESAA